MDSLLAFLQGLGPQHWLVLGLVLLIAEMASGTTYLLWPAVAAFITALVSLTGLTDGVAELIIFAAQVILLTWLGRPLVRRWRNEGAASGLNERSAALIGSRGVVASFANGVGSVKVQDTVWRAMSDEALEPGQAVVIDSVEGATLRVKRA
jgi:membrane protein implicated in regulation of membrane protease activity